MAFLLKALGGIAALILLVITLLGSIVTLGGVLLTAIKILIGQLAIGGAASFLLGMEWWFYMMTIVISALVGSTTS